jgi:hypothetical protein
VADAGEPAVIAMPADTAAAIEAIAREVQRLTPSWQLPEMFHEQKAEIIGLLRALAHPAVVTRTVVKFIAAPTPAIQSPRLLPVAPRAPTRQRRPVMRHRHPHPPRLPPDVQPRLWAEAK